MSAATAPLILGINRTQDGSVCLLRGSAVVCHLQKERITRTKYHWGKLGDIANTYLGRIPELTEPLDLVVECYSSDPEIRQLDRYAEELKRTLRFPGEPSIVQISHHLSHVYSAFFPSPFDEAAGLVVDCQGSYVRDFTESCQRPVDAPPDWVEVGSLYECTRSGIRCLSKQVWSGDFREPAGLGAFYFLLSHTLFGVDGSEGKVMGLAAYGNPDKLHLPPLAVDGHRVYIPAEWTTALADAARYRYLLDRTGSFEDCANLAAAGQRCFEEALLEVAKWTRRQSGSRNLCFAGGTAMNSVANGRLLREVGFDNIFIPPSCHDGGTALGCALYGLVAELGMRCDFRWTNDFLGPEIDATSVERRLSRAPGMIVERPPDLSGQVAELLDSGRVVALYGGRCESGQRALGHRSILADARRPGMRDWINHEVKGREWFRPLAPVVLEHRAGDFFDTDRPLPFMQFVVDVRPAARDLLPAITHVDGTARLQTVCRTDDPFLFDVLTAFETRTGVGVVLNTSLNPKNSPLVEAIDEALSFVESAPIYALVVPPFLARKRVEPRRPP